MLFNYLKVVFCIYIPTYRLFYKFMFYGLIKYKLLMYILRLSMLHLKIIKSSTTYFSSQQ